MLLLLLAAENDPPSFTAGSEVSVIEDSPPVSRPWATGMSAGPGETATLSFAVSNCVSANAALFAVPPTVTEAGRVVFTPAANMFAGASCTVRLNEVSAQGAVILSSAPATLDIVVAPGEHCSVVRIHEPGPTLRVTVPQAVTGDRQEYSSQWLACDGQPVATVDHAWL
jgi:hypothetical protein